MFGSLRPAIPKKNKREKGAFMKAYCNLCATLAKEFGMTSRTLLVFDFATLDWLFGANAKTPYAFDCFNCAKGGVRKKKQADIPERQRFLAGISAYAIGVKLKDDVQDSGAMTAKSMLKFYKKTFSKTKTVLADCAFDVGHIESALKSQQLLEAKQEGGFSKAAEPTGYAYGVVAEKMASFDSVVPASEAKQFGAFFGRAVYLMDALRDMKADLKQQAYNPFLQAQFEDFSSHLWQSTVKVSEYLREQSDALDKIAERIGGDYYRRWRMIVHAIEYQFTRVVSKGTGRLMQFPMINQSCGGGGVSGGEEDDEEGGGGACMGCSPCCCCIMCMLLTCCGCCSGGGGGGSGLPQT